MNSKQRRTQRRAMRQVFPTEINRPVILTPAKRSWFRRILNWMWLHTFV